MSNWSSSTTRWTGDSKESSGQVVLKHGPKSLERIRESILKFPQDTGYRTPPRDGMGRAPVSP